MIKKEHTTGFIGLTHLGIVSSICWAHKFPPVIGFDFDGEIIKKLSSGKVPIEEPQLQDLLDKTRNDLTFTTDFSLLSKCSTVFITQDIKTDKDNYSDYTPFYKLINKTIRYLPKGIIIVLMSQVSVGTCRDLKKHIKTRMPDLDFNLLYMIETLIIGKAVDRFIHPERIILGTESETEMMLDKFKLIKKQLNDFGAPLIVMKYESAELTKLAINFYLFISVTYANTISDLCEAYSADMNEIISALQLDRRIGPYAYIHPSLGVTGGNLERDMMTLKKSEQYKGIKSDLIDILVALNKTRYKWVEKKLQTHLLPKIKKPKIAIWGLAYKRDTNRLKNSPALKIINDLSDLADFSAYDPLVKSIGTSKKIKIYQNRYDATKGAHCLIILTDPDEFQTLDVERLKKLMDNSLIIDCVNIYSNLTKELTGINYISIGRTTLEGKRWEREN